MFSKIGIIQGGEMACRIIRACNELGISTVAFYTAAEYNALHVRSADQAVQVVNYAAREGMIEAAKKFAVDAIHPGYGELSEDPLFAQLCSEVGIVFIGPTPYVISQMGDKIKARQAAKKARIPRLPGTENLAYSTEEEISNAARKIGFPLMVKAAGGGGGRAIEVVESSDTLLSCVQKTRSLTEFAFGRPDIYLEKCIKGARHIEVQVICDHHKNYFHALERDCSLQRRRQKIVEESPAVGIKPKLRKKLYSWAIRLVRSIGYTNVGTVEFLVSPEGKAYFIEMNTRIQVEHGVTEMRQGIDLVKMQLAIADGVKLLPEANPRFQHTMQVRIYPELLRGGLFIPMPGRVTLQNFPQPIEHLRIDSALAVGETMAFTADSPAPLLAKVIVGASSRTEAIHRMLAALQELSFLGETNKEALVSLLSWDIFRKGEHTIDSLSNQIVLQERSAIAEQLTLERNLDQQIKSLTGEMAIDRFDEG